MANWYEPRNFELLKMADLNWLFVTFSTGFSLRSEEPHYKQMENFFAACHRQGIHVTAYMSIANIFPDDMFLREPQSRQWVAVDKQGQPIPYGSAAHYASSGFNRVNRYMACPLHAQWRAYLKKRVDRAIDAGADAVLWDNAGLQRCYCPRCTAGYAQWRARCGVNDEREMWNAYSREVLAALAAELHEHGLHKKHDLLMYLNCNRGVYGLNRACNAISTEDGTEPGLDAQGKPVNNIGLLRYQWAEGQGWRASPGGIRRTTPGWPLRESHDDPHVSPLSPVGHCRGGPRTAWDWNRTLRASSSAIFTIADPRRWPTSRPSEVTTVFWSNTSRSTSARAASAPVAMLTNDDNRQLDACKEMAGRGLIFDVVFAETLQPNSLAAYHTVIAPDVKFLSDAQLKILADWVRRGGRLVAAADTGNYTETFRRRPHSAIASWFGLQSTLPGNGVATALDQGSVRYFVQIADWDVVAGPLMDRQRRTFLDVVAPRTVLCNLRGQEGTSNWQLHLLNYGPEPVRNIKVTLPNGLLK